MMYDSYLHYRNVFLFSPYIVIEKFTENVRFCLICNYLSKIIPALQSRCTRFRFGPLSPDQMISRLKYIATNEGLVCTVTCLPLVVHYIFVVTAFLFELSIVYYSANDINYLYNHYTSVTMSEDGLGSVITLSQGDMRRAVNILQVCQLNDLPILLDK